MKTITEQFQTEQRGSFDVIVCGGGIAGTCAAVAAARQGARVLLLEKGVQLGGLATGGLVSFYEPICDGRGKKRMYGMAEELFRLAVQYGPDTLPPEWRDFPEEAEGSARCAALFSPALFAMALDRWLLDSGAEVLFDSAAVRPVMEREICRGVIVENKTGRGFYRAKTVVDATGDADLFFRAGAPCSLGQNFLSYLAYVADRETFRKAQSSGNLLDLRKLTCAGSDRLGRGHPQEFPLLSGTTAEEVTEFVLQGRKLFFEGIVSQPKDSRDVTVLPSMAQFRTTRRIAGEYTLTESDQGKAFPDSTGIAVDFYTRGRIYELPYRILYCRNYPNLFTAGRTVSSQDWAWEVTRVIPAAAATGQAAGTAAALCAKQEIPNGALNTEQLRQTLASAGVRLSL